MHSNFLSLVNTPVNTNPLTRRSALNNGFLWCTPFLCFPSILYQQDYLGFSLKVNVTHSILIIPPTPSATAPFNPSFGFEYHRWFGSVPVSPGRYCLSSPKTINNIFVINQLAFANDNWILGRRFDDHLLKCHY